MGVSEAQTIGPILGLNAEKEELRSCGHFACSYERAVFHPVLSLKRRGLTDRNRQAAVQAGIRQRGDREQKRRKLGERG